MRAMPSRQPTWVGPTRSCSRVLSVVTLAIVRSVTTKLASRPTRLARYSHHSSIETDSLPAQLTIVAGTDAIASRPGIIAMMSSSWIGLNWLGRSGCNATGSPARICSRWNAGQPPLSPYGTLSRAIVVGRFHWRAPVRTTASAAILAML